MKAIEVKVSMMMQKLTMRGSEKGTLFRIIFLYFPFLSQVL
jgi:hypothetical protein